MGAYAISAPQGVYDHPTLGRCLYSVREVSDDPDTQVAEVIGMMREYALEDSRSPYMYGDLDACFSCGDDPLVSVWSYLSRASGSRGMQFVSDEQTGAAFDGSIHWRPLVEALIRPADQACLSNPQGDCDDFSMYGASLLCSSGVPCKFVTVAADDSDPQMYSHVYLVAYPNKGKYAGRRVPIDLSHGSHLGWEVANVFGKRKEWGVNCGVGVVPLALLAAGAWFLYKAVA